MSECCKSCGRVLDKKWNKRMRYGEAEGYCNKKCAGEKRSKIGKYSGKSRNKEWGVNWR